MICVVDFDARRFYETNLANVCQQRDFNRIEGSSEPPDALEKVLGGLEGEIAKALRQVITAKSTCDDETWNWVLNLMSLIAARHPLVRAEVEQMKDAYLRKEAAKGVETPEIWAKRAQELLEAGYLTAEQAAHPYEDIKRFTDSGQFTISFPLGHLTEIEFKIQDDLLRSFGERYWSIFTTDDPKAEFLTTDRPVCLMHASGRADTPEMPVGFDDPDTIVLFPISPGVLAYGRFGHMPKQFKADALTVGSVNKTLLLRSYTSAFSPKDQFRIGREALTGKEVLARVTGPPGRRRRQKSRGPQANP
jgi:hypothetical protein